MDKMIGSYEIRNNDLLSVIDDVRGMSLEEKVFFPTIDLGKVAAKLGYNGSLSRDDREGGTGLSFSNDAVKMVCILKDFNPSEAECFIFKNFNIEEKSFLYSRVINNTTKCLEALGGLSEYVNFRLFRKTTLETKRSKKTVYKEIGIKNNPNYVFTYNEAKWRLASLLVKNIMGEDVFIEPVSNRYSFIVINNVYKKDLEIMIKGDVIPNIVLNTSWDRYQVVFVFPKHLPDKIFRSFSEEISLKYGGKLSGDVFDGHNLIHIPGTKNMDKEALRHNCHPDIEIEMEPNSNLSEGLKKIELEVLKKPHIFFEDLQKKIRDFQGFTTNSNMDLFLATEMHVSSRDVKEKINRLDMYFSDDEQIAMLIGNGISEKASSGNIGYIEYKILDKIYEFQKKQYKPIIETELFSPPKPFFQKDENEDDKKDEIPENNDENDKTEISTTNKKNHKKNFFLTRIFSF